MARARHCADRLAGLAANTDGVDMSDFLLHEAMAQLQLGFLCDCILAHGATWFLAHAGACMCFSRVLRLVLGMWQPQPLR